MTTEEAKDWYGRMTEEDRIKHLHEWWQLKQILCAQTLLVPTGAVNWIARAIARAEHLSACRSDLKKVLRELTGIVEETTPKEFRDFPECTNCTGKGTVGDDTCVCCRGSGKRVISI
jgi:hypothetical protein